VLIVTEAEILLAKAGGKWLATKEKEDLQIYRRKVSAQRLQQLLAMQMMMLRHLLLEAK